MLNYNVLYCNILYCKTLLYSMYTKPNVVLVHESTTSQPPLTTSTLDTYPDSTQGLHKSYTRCSRHAIMSVRLRWCSCIPTTSPAAYWRAA